MKKILYSVLLSALLLTGCSYGKTQTYEVKNPVDIYVSQDVDVFGNKIDKDATTITVGGSRDDTSNVEEVAADEETILDYGELKVYFIDVGQADCILLQISGDENILIDGGNNGDGEDLVDYLEYLGVDEISTIVATHPHEDHIGGLDTVMDNIPVDKIYLPYVKDSDVPTTVTYKDFLNAIDENELIVCEAKNGDIIYESDVCKLEIISPDDVEEGDLNDYSIVLKLQYGNNSFMFTGDASINIDDFIMNNYSSDFLDIDVLKVGHHGSRTSTNDAWIKALSPEYAVIMCETDNSYGHPHKEALKALNDNNVEIYRTDQDGTILMTSDGNNITVETKLTGDYPLGNTKFSMDNVKQEE